ncbi:hypothetical protein G9A89_001441 [Geosiphon pyriformis]|nr:hypothetical protein G9A89_001441 [Geosiphon pyriformis]
MTELLRECRHASDELPGRYGHSAVLLNNTIYIIGGTDGRSSLNSIATIELYSNFSVYNQSNFLFNKPIENFSGVSWGTAILTHLKDNSPIIYVIGDVATKNLTKLQLNSSPLLAETVNINPNTGVSPDSRQDSSVVFIDHGTIYIYGGASLTKFPPSNPVSDNRMYIINLYNQSLSMVPPQEQFSVTLPTRVASSATLMPDGKIIFLGGRTYADTWIEMDKIWIFDTKTNLWKQRNATFEENRPIVHRGFHSAVLAPNNREIIVYGGYSDSALQNLNALVVLNTDDWEWSIPDVTNSKEFTPIPFGHSATIYDHYMIIAFGASQANNNFPITDKVISILDIENNKYEWVDDLRERPRHRGRKRKLGAILGGTFGSIGGLLLIMALVWLFIRRRRLNNNREQIISMNPTTPANSSNRRLFTTPGSSNRPLNTSSQFVPPMTNLNLSDLPPVKSRRPLQQT